MTTNRQPQHLPGQQPVAAGRGISACEPLVSLSKTTIECRRARTSDHQGRPATHPQPISLSSRTSSNYLDIASFSTSSLSSFKSRSQFEQLFEIFPDSNTTPVPNFLARFSLEEHCPFLPESACLTASTALEIPSPFLKLDAVPPVAMSLRKYASTESDDSASARPRSLVSRLLDFGRGHSEHSSSGHSSEHGSGHESDDERRRQDVSSDSSPQSEDQQASSKYLLTPSALAVSTARHTGAAATHGTSPDVSLVSEADTARATHEAMNTPITIPHSSTAPVTHGHQRPPIQLLGRKDDTPKVMTATIANEGSFLWKAFKSSPQSRKKDAVKGFKYTGENEYFVMCDPDFVAIGGGRGKFGLWMKSDFLHGYSARCPTFNNEPLGLDSAPAKSDNSDTQQEFVVGHFEIWAFNT
ncbi:oxidation resistance protein 1 [Coemansia sp. IMI 209128]|nr:oxidation resistance protein 1 [Coemansia sp. IMI 209128]